MIGQCCKSLNQTKRYMTPTSGISKLIDLAIYSASAIGFLSSLVLCIFGILAFPQPLSGWAASLSLKLMFLLIPIVFAFVLRYNNLNYDRTQREITKTMYSGCPIWMRTTAYCLMALGLILFFLPGLWEVLGYIPHSGGNSIPSTTPGGFGLLVFTSFIAQLYSARAIAKTSEDRRIIDITP